MVKYNGYSLFTDHPEGEAKLLNICQTMTNMYVDVLEKSGSNSVASDEVCRYLDHFSDEYRKKIRVMFSKIKVGGISRSEEKIDD